MKVSEYPDIAPSKGEAAALAFFSLCEYGKGLSHQAALFALCRSAQESGTFTSMLWMKHMNPSGIRWNERWGEDRKGGTAMDNGTNAVWLLNRSMSEAAQAFIDVTNSDRYDYDGANLLSSNLTAFEMNWWALAKGYGASPNAVYSCFVSSLAKQVGADVISVVPPHACKAALPTDSSTSFYLYETEHMATLYRLGLPFATLEYDGANFSRRLRKFTSDPSSLTGLVRPARTKNELVVALNNVLSCSIVLSEAQIDAWRGIDEPSKEEIEGSHSSNGSVENGGGNGTQPIIGASMTGSVTLEPRFTSNYDALVARFKELGGTDIPASILAAAAPYVGAKWVMGGTSYTQVDCSAFVGAIIKQHGGSPSRTARGMQKQYGQTSMDVAAFGDTVGAVGYQYTQKHLPPGTAGHILISLGNGLMMHTSTKADTQGRFGCIRIEPASNINARGNFLGWNNPGIKVASDSSAVTIGADSTSSGESGSMSLVSFVSYFQCYDIAGEEIEREGSSLDDLPSCYTRALCHAYRINGTAYQGKDGLQAAVRAALVEEIGRLIGRFTQPNRTERELILQERYGKGKNIPAPAEALSNDRTSLAGVTIDSAVFNIQRDQMESLNHILYTLATIMQRLAALDRELITMWVRSFPNDMAVFSGVFHPRSLARQYFIDQGMIRNLSGPYSILSVPCFDSPQIAIAHMLLSQSSDSLSNKGAGRLWSFVKTGAIGDHPKASGRALAEFILQTAGSNPFPARVAVPGFPVLSAFLGQPCNDIESEGGSVKFSLPGELRTHIRYFTTPEVSMTAGRTGYGKLNYDRLM